MTREEEIRNIANTISTNIGKEIDEDYICADIYDFTIGFACGAKWADKTMLEKACVWLKNGLMDNRDNCGYPTVSTFDTFTLNEFIEEFKKAMEE